jgi:cob(I)alamin adenosyltransferase
MAIYTRRGDDGTTDLRDQSSVSKDSPRIEAYGTVDEVNALLGVARPTGQEDVDAWLGAIQNDLHVIQAVLACPDPESEPRIESADVDRLEEWIDEADEELQPLESFILPGGSDAGAELHHARAVCRRAERRAVEIAGIDPVDESAISYLNRLSDALFTFARLVNAREGVPEESPTY